MSRIGKYPIAIPEKVSVSVDGTTIKVKGPVGEMVKSFPDNINIQVKDKEVLVTPKSKKDVQSRAMHGTASAIIKNLITGANEAFKRVLEFNGVGYKAAVKGDTLVLNLGYSHPIDYKIPKGVAVKVVKSTIELSSCDKELLGFVAAKIRSFRGPEPYKGKGIKYSDERIIRKAGKTTAKK